MNLTETINILKDHNAWRLGEEIQPHEPKEITEAINSAIKFLKEIQQTNPVPNPNDLLICGNCTNLIGEGFDGDGKCSKSEYYKNINDHCINPRLFNPKKKKK